MNEVIVQEEKKAAPTLHSLMGSIWKDEEDCYYILSQIAYDEFNFIFLEDGNRMLDSFRTLEELEREYKYMTKIADKAKITIEVLE